MPKAKKISYKFSVESVEYVTTSMQQTETKHTVGVSHYHLDGYCSEETFFFAQHLLPMRCGNREAVILGNFIFN